MEYWISLFQQIEAWQVWQRLWTDAGGLRGEAPPRMRRGLILDIDASGSIGRSAAAYPPSRSCHLQPSVVVAMIRMRMMQMIIDQVIGVVAVRHRLMPAVRPVPMALVVGIALVVWRAVRRVLPVHLEPMLVHMIGVRMVQMAVVQVIRMAVVHDRGVPAIRTMLMGMTVVCLVCHF